jgi:hypothetical protein
MYFIAKAYDKSFGSTIEIRAGRLERFHGNLSTYMSLAVL